MSQPQEQYIYYGHSHSFDLELAKKAGLNSAIVYQYILDKIQSLKRNNDEEFQVKITYREVVDYFGFISQKKVMDSIFTLEYMGLIKRGRNTKNKFDQSMYFARGPSDIFQCLYGDIGGEL